MKPSLLRTGIVVAALMFAASVLAVVLRPTHKIADQGPRVDLEAMIPEQFADWRADKGIVPIQVSPDVQAKLDEIYNQTLNRTYINGKGQRVMLSIAYGGDQSDSMQVHRPEICYPAQGFQVLKLAAGMLDTGFGSIRVKRLLTAHGARVEPILYWITVGDTVAVGGLNWKLAQLKYGLTGKIPDGLLFRVSSLGDEATAYPVQEDFTKGLLKALKPENRKRLIGSAS